MFTERETAKVEQSGALVSSDTAKKHLRKYECNLQKPTSKVKY